MATPARTVWERDRKAARENPWMWKLFGLLGSVQLLNGLVRLDENPWLAWFLVVAGVLMTSAAVWCFRQTRRTEDGDGTQAD